jgi:hypothetical protein
MRSPREIRQGMLDAWDKLERGKITREQVHQIVDAANKELLSLRSELPQAAGGPAMSRPGGS